MNIETLIATYIVLWLLLLLFVWIVPAYFVGVAARNKSRSFAAFFFLSLGVSWLLMAIIVAALPFSRIPGQPDAQRRICPMCDEGISVNARMCKHCGSQVTPATYSSGFTATESFFEQPVEEFQEKQASSSRWQTQNRTPLVSGLSGTDILELTDFYREDPQGFITDSLTQDNVREWLEAGRPNLEPWIKNGLPDFHEWIRRS